MAYCTTVDVKNFIPASVIQQLSDDNDSDEIDAEKVTFCTQQADDLIDSYLRGRYPVPLVTVPSMIRDLSVRATVYFLSSRFLGVVKDLMWLRRKKTECSMPFLLTQ